MGALRQREQRLFSAGGVEITAAAQQFLQGVGDGGDFGLMEARRTAAVGLDDFAAAHRAFVPNDFAHVLQTLGDGAARTCDEGKQPHIGGDPLLTFVALTRGHEELDGPLDAHRLAVHPALHFGEGDGEIDGLLSFRGHVADLAGDGLQVA